MKLIFVFSFLFLTGCVHFQRTVPAEVKMDQKSSIQDSIDRDIQRENQKRNK